MNQIKIINGPQERVFHRILSDRYKIQLEQGDFISRSWGRLTGMNRIRHLCFLNDISIDESFVFYMDINRISNFCDILNIVNDHNWRLIC